jgi:hypothetical protein
MAVAKSAPLSINWAFWALDGAVRTKVNSPSTKIRNGYLKDCECVMRLTVAQSGLGHNQKAARASRPLWGGHSFAPLRPGDFYRLWIWGMVGSSHRPFSTTPALGAPPLLI